MKKILFLLLIISGVYLLAAPVPQQPIDQKIWIRIDSLEAEGLYRSALELTNKVYDQAKIKSDAETEIRALLYKLKYTQELEEEGQLAAITTLEKELPDDHLVQGSLKYSILAELYYRYYSANRWQISQNPMEEKTAGQPLKSWSPERFYRHILAQYDLSLEKEDQLAMVKVGSLPGLWTGNLADTLNKPSLYDVLISRALGFLENSSEFSLPALKPAFFCSPELFSEPASFIKALPVADADGNNPYFRALKWYGEWLHKAEKWPLVAADLKRLQYAHEQSCHEKSDSLYEAGLLGWTRKIGRDSSIAAVYESLAQYHIDQAGRFEINHTDTLKYKFERKLAAEWLSKAQEWSGTLAGKRCLNLSKSLLNPELSVRTEDYQLPESVYPVSVEYRNVKTLYYRIIRMNALSYYSGWSNLEPAEKIIRISGSRTERTGTIELPDDGMMNPHRVNILIDPLPAGFYLLAFYNQQEISSKENLLVTVPVSVTRINLVTNQNHAGGRDFYFRDRDNGSALGGLTIVPWFNLFDAETRMPISEKGKVYRSGAEGYLNLHDDSPGRDDSSPKAYRLQVINKTDTLVTGELFYPGYSPVKSRAMTTLKLYTDRGIYKPGEEVHFRGVLLDYYGDSIAIHRMDSITLNIQDPRYMLVGRIVLPVDSLGVFTGSTRLPYKGTTGSYFIQSKYGQTTVRMEQYRRPAFSVTILPGSEIFQPGQEMQVSGKVVALSGEPVSGANIVADIDIQSAGGPRRWSPYMSQKIRIKSVNAISDSTGRFVCKWNALPVNSNPFGTGAISYSIVVRATDLNGETHQEETRIDCGKGTTTLSLDLPDNLLSDKEMKGTIGAVGTDGRVLKVPVRLKISKLNDPLRSWIDPVLPEPDRFMVSEGEWQKKVALLPYKNEHQPSSWSVSGVVSETAYPNDTITKISVLPAGKWQRGWYKIELIPVNPSVCKSKTKYLYIEDSHPGKIDPNQPLFVQISAQKADPGQTLNLSYATNQKGFVLIELRKMKGDPLVCWKASDRRPMDLNWIVTDDWQGGAVLHVIMVRSNRVYEKTIPITVSWVNSTLSISGFEQLDRVKPGDSVNISLTVRDENGSPVRASLGLTVYDASLDLIVPHSWSSVVKPVFNSGSLFKALESGISGSYTLAEPDIRWVNVPDIQPVELNWFGLGYFGISRRMDVQMMKMAVSQPAAAKGGMDRSAVNELKSVEAVADADLQPVVAQTETDGNPLVIRSDFRETAVFIGNLVTDGNGHATAGFKVPEVFTEWKVLATAHDSGLSFGNLEHRFKSSKDLMLKPNFPDFIRKGDSVELSARLGWYGKGTLKTVTSLTLSDTSGRVLNKYPDITSSLASGAVAPFSWSLVAGKPEPFTYLLQSTSMGSNDGLTDTITVYPDEVQLWNSQPFFFAKPGKKKLEIAENPIEALFEVTTTPVWQVLQSLPVVNKQEQDCSEYWFSRLYLAALTGSIADRFPAIAGQYLSDSVPETQKDRIAQIRDWMNKDTRIQEASYVLDKLYALQNQDGTWPWFKGMGTDMFMTQQIIAGFGEMKLWGIMDITSSQNGNYMVTRAIEAMDRWMFWQYQEVIRMDSVHPQKVQLSPMVIHALYARSFFPTLSMNPSQEIAMIHFTERIKLEWTQHDPGLQALMAISRARLGYQKDALPILKSLRERAKTDDQWGMYWPRKGYGSSFFQWDLWMQSRMIELFDAVEEGNKDLDQLRMYLIHQKRGRDWGNGMVAAWATKSMLFYGSSKTMAPASVGMTWGKEQYSPLRIKTGGMGVTGYYRFEWKNAREIPESRSALVTHTQGGPAWGTLQTLNNYHLDKLAATAGPLNVSREAMIQNDQGVWKPVADNQTIHVGDVIRIRLAIKSDRELSYIEVKDNLGTGFMPLQMVSGFHYNAGLSYYQSRQPESLVFYVSQLPRGESTIEYQAVIEQAGNYFGGYATATSLYAPEFRAWSDSFRVHARR